jgi:hypothetical protein
VHTGCCTFTTIHADTKAIARLPLLIAGGGYTVEYAKATTNPQKNNVTQEIISGILEVQLFTMILTIWDTEIMRKSIPQTTSPNISNIAAYTDPFILE